MKIILRAIVVAYACLAFSPLFAEQIRDYYAEPGLHPFKGSINQHFNEHIDPFGGTLQLSYLDLKIPGNGGMDINVYRTYTSRQNWAGEENVAGVGWTMHMGRVVVTYANRLKICSQNTYNVSALNNPSLELPDGRRELLFLYVDQTKAELITKSRWKARCETTAVSDRFKLTVTSPDGTEYIMDQYGIAQDGPDSYLVSYYATQIKDTNGNILNINYKTDKINSGQYVYIDSITASPDDGRLVQFNYLNEGTTNLKLESITANNQTWYYNYQQVNTNLYEGSRYNLTEVVRPDGVKWQYSYYEPGHVGGGEYSLKTVTYPYGGAITYVYDKIAFSPAIFGPTTAVVSKSVSGPNITANTWSFAYEPAYVSGRDYDRTTITAPDAQYVYEHYGYSYSASAVEGTLWSIGLLHKKEIYSRGGGGNPVESETNTWDSQLISTENIWHGATLYDNQVLTPVLTKKVVTREYTDYITYYDHDLYGNVIQKIEVANTKDPSTSLNVARRADYTYNYDETKWIVNLPKDEYLYAGVISANGTFSGATLASVTERTYDAKANLLIQSVNGVTSTYTYTSEGDVETAKNARQHTTTYSDYYRGIPREEIHPVSSTENITRRRTVNATGTVESETNGRGFTTSYGYDGLNRLKTITYPKTGSASVTINYPTTNYYNSATQTSNTINTGKLLTRGNYLETAVFDGFGNVINVERKDTVSSATITANSTYDALNRKTFTSFQNSTIGICNVYDEIGRLKRINKYIDSSYCTNYGMSEDLMSAAFPDATYQTYTYLTNNKVLAHNERDLNSTLSYRSFGTPAKQELIRIDSPENILTEIQRNILGLTTRVWQGDAVGGVGYEKTYGYDSRYFLTSMTQPEIGTTLFGRDEVGNLTGKQIGTTLLANYQYDYQNRQTYQDYFDASFNNVNISYDGNGNVKTLTRGSGNAALSKSFTYDDNDNLQREDIQYGLQSFAILYDHTNLDHVNTISYPSGRVVTYAPNALGRPTQVSPYVTSVQYHPSGQVKQMAYANGQTTDISLTSRLWVDTMVTNGVTSAVNLDYGYDNLGNIKSILDGIDPTYNRNFIYDGVDRLTTANGVWGTGALSYDALGNLQTKTIGAHSLTYNYDNLTNRLDTITGSQSYTLGYDLQGNITNTGSYLSTYDEAGNLVETNVAGSITDYRYDGNNRRAVKIGAAWTYYLYAQNDNLLGEYDSKGVWKKEFIYLGSQQVAQATRQPDLIPNQPESLTVPEGNADGNYSISWSNSTGIVFWYELDEATTLDFSDAVNVLKDNVTTVYLSNRSIGTYYYRVKACNLDGCSPYLNSAHGLTVGLPVAKAGGDISANENSEVILDGSQSFGTASPITEHLWKQISGPYVQLINANSNAASFETPFVTQTVNMVFELKVIDGVGNSNTDTVTVTVKYSDTDNDSLSDLWEIYYFSNLTANKDDDPDGDGVSNYDELLYGYNPTQTQGPTPVINIETVSLYKQNNISWAPVSNATSYNLYWSISPDITTQNSTKLINVTSPHYHSNLINGNKYYYIVTAVNQYGESTASTIMSSIPKPPWTDPHVLLSSIHNMGLGLYMDPEGNASVHMYDYYATQSTFFADFDIVTGWSYSTGPIFGYWSVPAPMVTNENREKATVQVGTTPLDDIDNIFVSLYSPESGWAAPLQITTNTDPDTFLSSPNIAINKNGTVVVVWINGTPGVGHSIHSRRYTKDAGWSDIEIVDRDLTRTGYRNDLNGDALLIELDDIGNAIVAWHGDEAIGENWQPAIYTTRYVNGRGWLAPVSLTKNMSGLNVVNHFPSLEVNNKGDAVLTWIREDQNSIYRSAWYAVHFTQDTGWMTPTIVSVNDIDASAGTGTVKLSDAGKAMFVWMTYNPTSGSKEIYANRYTPINGWSGPELLDSFDTQYNSSHLAFDKHGNAIVIWSELDPELIINPNYEHVIATKRFSVVNGWYPKEYLAQTFSVSYGETKVEESDNGFVSILTAKGHSIGIEEDLQILHTQIGNGDNLLAPTLSIPDDISLEATDVLSPVDIGNATARDINGISIPATPDSVGPFAVGVNTVNWSAIDAAGNTTIQSQDIIVKDTTPPTLTVPTDVVHYVQSTEPAVVDIGTPAATDIFPVTITNDAPSAFPLGENIVTWSATDTNYQQAKLTQSVVVQIEPGYPIPNAGVDQIVLEGATVTLDAAASIDTDGTITSYLWTQLTGPDLRLRKTAVPILSFTAPAVTTATDFTFELAVTDDAGNTTTDKVTVIVKPLSQNTPPSANAGTNQTVYEGMLIVLDGTASSDIDGSIVSYQWSQVSGPTVTLSDLTAVKSTFTAPAVTTNTDLVFELQVTDEQGASGTSTVTVTVQDDGGIDRVAPITTGTFTSTTSKGYTYYDVSLSSNEAGTTYFRLTGGATIISGGADTTAWQTYNGAINIKLDKGGTANFEYYSVDTAGNTEATKTEVLQ